MRNSSCIKAADRPSINSQISVSVLFSANRPNGSCRLLSGSFRWPDCEAIAVRDHASNWTLHHLEMIFPYICFFSISKFCTTRMTVSPIMNSASVC